MIGAAAVGGLLPRVPPLPPEDHTQVMQPLRTTHPDDGANEQHAYRVAAADDSLSRSASGRCAYSACALGDEADDNRLANEQCAHSATAADDVSPEHQSADEQHAYRVAAADDSLRRSAIMGS